MNLRLKFTIPVSIGFFISLLVVLFIAKSNFKKTIDSNINNTVELQDKNFKSSIKKIKEKAAIPASFYAGLKTVKKGLEYQKIKNIDTAHIILRDKYISLNNSFKKSTDETFNIAFYNLNGVCIFRSWDTEYGDIVNNSFIKNAEKNIKATKDIIVDKYGTFVSAASPVFNASNEIIGVCEVRFPIHEVIKATNLAPNEELSVLVNTDLLDNQVSNISIINIGIFSPVAQSSESFSFAPLKRLLKDNIISNHQIYKADTLVYSITPIKNNNEQILGAYAYQINISDDLNNLSSINNSILTLVIILMALIALFFHFYGKIILTKPLHTVVDHIENFAKGIIETNIKVNTKDEIGKINRALNTLGEGLLKLTEFAKNIGNGNFDAEFEPLSDKDEIGQALIDMRNKLVEAKKKEELQKEEERKRAWATQGLALFGEILRQNDNDMETFGKNIIQNLVKYTESNQGALYILEEEEHKEPYLKLLATYAYNRFKAKEDIVALGDGLVGTCAIEKESIYLTDVPENYIQITSGLGEALPRNVLIVPLKVEEEVYGVIELASFNIFEDYIRDFIENLAKNIASSIHSTKTNILTAQLLEQSRQQQEEMKAQEEELRQNMEELMATQEEAMRRQSEMTGLYNAINDNQLVAEYQIDGTITKLNQKYEEIFGININDFIGQNYNSINIESESISNDELWEKLRNKEIVSRKVKVTIGRDNSYWLHETFSPIVDDNGNILKIVSISSDITEEKLKEQELKQNHEELKAQEEEMRQNMEELLATQEESMRREAEMEGLYNAINNNSLVAEFDLNGNILDINQRFAELFNIEKEKFIGQNYNNLNIDTEDDISNEELWKRLAENQVVSRKIKITTSTGNVFWLHETFAPIQDESGDIIKIIDVSHNITEEKLREVELTQNQEEMKAQEEEMRQNMEEMLAMQEESEAKEEELLKLYSALFNNLAVIEYDKDYTVVEANQLFLDLFRFESADEVKNKAITEVMPIYPNELDKIIKAVKKGETYTRKNSAKIGRKTYNLKELHIAVLSDDGEIDKVICIILQLD